jgi:hypothetical protein
VEKGVGGDGLGFLSFGLTFAPGLDDECVERRSVSATGGVGPVTSEVGGARPPIHSGILSIHLCLALTFACLLLLSFAAGCGGSSGAGGGGLEAVAEQALRAALEGNETAFANLVAPSFMQKVRSEMPDAEDETLGRVLIAGFLEDIPFAGIVTAAYGVEADSDKAVVYVWGVFIDSSGNEIEIGEAGALRIPLVREEDRWYLDLLDL